MRFPPPFRTSSGQEEHTRLLIPDCLISYCQLGEEIVNLFVACSETGVRPQTIHVSDSRIVPNNDCFPIQADCSEVVSPIERCSGGVKVIHGGVTSETADGS